MKEAEIMSLGGPKGFSASKSIASTRSNRHLLKRAPNTFARLHANKETLCYHEKEDGNRVYHWERRFNKKLGCYEFVEWKCGDIYLTKYAIPGVGTRVKLGWAVIPSEYQIAKLDWEEPSYSVL